MLKEILVLRVFANEVRLDRIRYESMQKFNPVTYISVLFNASYKSKFKILRHF